MKDFQKIIKKIAISRVAIPILGCCLLDADTKTITATDIDIVVTSKAPIKGKGKAIIDASAIKGLPEIKEIRLEKEYILLNGFLKVARSDLSPADFPIMIEDNLQPAGNIQVNDLKAVIPFASTEATRYYLNGICLDKQAMIATDGHKLRIIDICGLNGCKKQILPTAFVNCMIASGYESFEIELSDSRVRATNGDTVILSKLVDGTFPDYHRVIPELEKANNKIVIDKKKLTQAIKKSKVLKNISGQSVLTLEFSGRQSRIAAFGSTQCEIDTTEAAACNQGDITTGFNVDYISTIINDIDSDTINMHGSDDNSPFLIAPTAKMTTVLMPMRV